MDKDFFLNASSLMRKYVKCYTNIFLTKLTWHYLTHMYYIKTLQVKTYYHKISIEFT